MADDKFLFKVALSKSTQGYRTKVEVSKGDCECGDYGLQDHLNSRLANNLGVSKDTFRGRDGKGPEKSRTKTWFQAQITSYLNSPGVTNKWGHTVPRRVNLSYHRVRSSADNVFNYQMYLTFDGSSSLPDEE